MRHSYWWLLALALIAAPACNDDGGGDDPTPPDDGTTNPPPGTKPDGNEKPEPGSVKLGGLCDQDDECSSGFCVTIGSGEYEGVCSKRCEQDNDCEIDRWSCRNIVTGSGDEIRGCAPKTLCIDNDGDGYGIGPECKGSDCDDNDPTVYEGAPEICDGKDNSCDGRIDNSPVDVGHNCNTNLEGVCADGVTECHSGSLECIQLQMPGQEICDGLDNDCDGLIDESVQEDENGNYVEQIGRACAPDGSSCQNGLYICKPYEHGGLHCDGLGDEAEEICDGIDNNCNGQIDEGIEGLGDVCIVGYGVCVNASAKICDPEDPHADPICDVEPDESKKTEEVCDYEDNDCNGIVDDPFVNEDGTYFTTEHCGGCDNDCAVQWGSDVDPATVHAKPVCSVSGSSAACDFECTGGYIDFDGVADNGCELLPDENGIYVATPAKGGADSNTCGSYDAPCATIGRGLTRAEAEGRKNVRVSDGIFREGIVLKNGISVLGGHSSVNWLRDTSVNTTTIYGAASAFPDDAVSVVARNITSATEFSGFSVTAPDAPEGGNSIALFVEGSNDKLVIKDNTLQAGVGGQGSVGQAGTDGQEGEDGTEGVRGYAHDNCNIDNWLDPSAGGQTTCGNTSTHGGRGGGSSCPVYAQPNQTDVLPQNGQNSSGSAGEKGFSAYARGGFDNACMPHKDLIDESFATDGTPGSIGNNGNGGDGANGNGSLVSSMWRAATGKNGNAGTPGGGGGGGGAAHGVQQQNGSYGRSYQLGSTGGGGGAGGCEGNGARGGSGGGGSFALYLLASGNNAPSIQNNTLIRGVGGVGGSGGLGGVGGFGGSGGVGGTGTYRNSPSNYNYIFCAQTGRTGGDGGRGGHGGGGGGGAGGNAFDIASKGMSSSALSAIANNNEFVVGESEDTAGDGGDGGPSMGTPGQAGSKGQSGRQFTLP